MRERNNLIIQGRVAWYFAKQSTFPILNILLTVAPEIGAQRSGEKKENVGKTIDEMAAADAAREKMERGRYKMLYGIENHLDPAHYDFVLDTTSLSEQEVFEKVVSAIRK
jgi:cytidylate kinase